MALAHWVANGSPPFDLWPVDIRRFGASHRDTTQVRKRTLESYARHYTICLLYTSDAADRTINVVSTKPLKR